MENKGTVIRFVNQLDMGEDAKRLAYEMLDQIDTPVVFLIDTGLDKNYAGRHAFQHNQFWVTANHQPEQSEYERVILSNLYRGIQARRRFPEVVPDEAYYSKLEAISDPKSRKERIENYQQLIGKINAITSTIDAEYHLAPRGIIVSEFAKRRNFDDRIRILDRYLEIQRKAPFWCWHKELALHNMLDYSRIAYWNSVYFRGISNRLNCVLPPHDSKKFLSQLKQLVRVIKTAKEKYASEPETDVPTWMINEIIAILQIKDMVRVEYPYSAYGTFNLENGENVPLYSFVPEGIQGEAELILGIRHVNEGILLLQDYSGAIKKQELPDIHANLVRSDHCNAYANKLDGEYYVSFTIGMLKLLMRSSDEIDLSSVPREAITLLGEREVRCRLRKYIIYFIAAHEYAHVLNGDCDHAESMYSCGYANQAKEENADLKAQNLLGNALFLQYRNDPNEDIIRQVQKMRINHVTDKVLFEVACNWCNHQFNR